MCLKINDYWIPLPRPHSNTQMHHSMTPTCILYYANLDLVNVVSAGSSFITIKLNAFESVVFTRGNFILVNMFVLQNVSLLHENSAEI